MPQTFPSLNRPTWPVRFASAGVWVVGVGLLAALVAGPLTRFNVVGFQAGLLTLVGGALLAVLGSLAGIIGWLGATAKRVPIRAGATGLAIVVGLALFGYLLSQVIKAFGVPPIHEISTDLSDPPAFVAVRAIRERTPGVNPTDYVTEIKGRGGVPINVPESQRKAYPDMQPLVLEIPAVEAFVRAEKAARALGWEIQEAAPAEGRLEATDTTFFFGFKDDVVVRIRSEGAGSRVDVRSKSRVGLGDVGANAKRIRAFLAAVKRG
jgi:uncharacterized protein (DUF1499 family)